ncbi:hypothetical protein Tco_0772231 [Tanacetum coccineum]|uniref:Uncharacterized protein n=1 Tax=Tanacetum coccineum TaxID=301880 RepID=A0ABQ4ZHL0_9ASTR
MGTPTLICVRSCPNSSAPASRPFSFLYIVSCVMIDHYVALPSFRHRRGVTDWYQSQDNAAKGDDPKCWPACCRITGRGNGCTGGRGGRGRRPKEGKDEHVDDLNGQGNDQGLRANRGVEGVNENVEGVNGGVGNQGNVGNQNGNVVNENVQENGVKSYQKKLNLTKPDTYRSNLRNKPAYTSHSDPHGIIYVDQFKRKRLMRIDELHKFSDGTLNDVRTALHDIAAGIRMEYLPMRK